jgi:eukaryotic-like serine/threonine-protein kinase
MGVVYRAKDTRLRRYVGLKFASNDTVANSNLYEYMLREAHAGSALNHPNVCAVYDIGEFQGLPYIVMEIGRLATQPLRMRLMDNNSGIRQGEALSLGSRRQKDDQLPPSV